MPGPRNSCTKRHGSPHRCMLSLARRSLQAAHSGSEVAQNRTIRPGDVAIQGLRKCGETSDSVFGTSFSLPRVALPFCGRSVSRPSTSQFVALTSTQGRPGQGGPVARARGRCLDPNSSRPRRTVLPASLSSTRGYLRTEPQLRFDRVSTTSEVMMCKQLCMLRTSGNSARC